MSDVAGEARIQRALKLSLGVAAGLALVTAAAVLLVRRDEDAQTSPEAVQAGPQLPKAPAVAAPAMPFTDVTAEAGIDFVHRTGAYGERLLPETMGGGVAFFDYDKDGHPDLLFLNSMDWPWQPQPDRPATSRLYRNQGDGTFADVSAATGMDITLYGMGVATGDYDGDGLVDVFVAGVGENRLYRNIGGERFEDATDTAGVASDGKTWSTSAAFLDFDLDGDLDLFVCNYVGWSPEVDREVDFRLTGIGRAYGPPTDFPGTNSWLYRNDGGTFTEISAEAGIEVANSATGAPVGKALAVRPLDINDDGWLDLAVANDTTRNFVFVNQEGTGFREAGVELGAAFDAAGLATGAMGIDAVQRDDGLTLAIGNFANEMSSFYVLRPGEGIFSDDAIVAGVGPASRRALTFGLLFLDADLDGRIDLIAANGHVEPEINRVQASQQYPQPAQLFWNCGTDCRGPFIPLEDTGSLATPRIGRGLAYADIDGDGDLDLALTQTGGKAALLRNDQDTGNAWIRIALDAPPPNAQAIGATVTVTAAGRQQARTVMPARSYLSSVEATLTFGLGAATAADSVTVQWPDGMSETWHDVTANTAHELRRGSTR